MIIRDKSMGWALLIIFGFSCARDAQNSLKRRRRRRRHLRNSSSDRDQASAARKRSTHESRQANLAAAPHDGVTGVET